MALYIPPITLSLIGATRAKTFGSQAVSLKASERLSRDMAFSAESYAANRAEQRSASAMGIICTIRFCDDLSRWVQPPDAENRMSGGVGGITDEIPLSPPDPDFIIH